MSNPPLLSYIVLSYNYADYIGTTIRSILGQTVQDFEIVVVDDASRDASVDVVRSFSDPRIRLLINDHNLGGAGSYNRAVAAARGDWLVNLDADDWIAPQKAERQLAAAAADPGLDIIGTYVHFVDAHGAPHPQAAGLEPLVNAPHELGLADSWVGTNSLSRSSTMVRRATHLRIGLDDPTMVRAPDYELWTRALREGCRFHVIPEQLTFCRLMSRGVTHGDPVGTLLELSYAMLRNLVPLCEAGALNQTLARIIAWTARHPQLSALRPVEAYRLLGMLMTSPSFENFASFRAALAAADGDPALARTGRRCLILSGDESSSEGHISKLERDIMSFVEARDFWHRQCELSGQEASDLRLQIANLERHVANIAESRDFWRGQTEGTVLCRLARLTSRGFSLFFRSS